MAFRLQIHKKGDQVKIFTEDKQRDISNTLPMIVKEVQGLYPDELALDCETVWWKNGRPIPRHKMMAIIAGKKPLTGEDIRANIFDILWYKGVGSLVNKPWTERQTYLRKVLAQDTSHLKRTKPIMANTEKGIREAFEKARSYPGSEGSMLKLSNSIYPLTGHTRDWCLRKGTPILTKKGFCPIEKIEPGMEVMANSGFTQVVAKQTFKFNQIRKLNIKNIPDIICSENHRFLTVSEGNLKWQRKYDREWKRGEIKSHRVDKNGVKYRWPNSRKNELFAEEWIQAKDLKKGDWLLIPKEFQVNEIKIDQPLEWFYLLGWYAAEGYVDQDCRVRIGLGKNAREEVIELSKIAQRLKLKFTLELTEKQNRLTIRESNLAKKLKVDFGKNAHLKCLPDYILFAPKECVQEFLRGYLSGDGHYSVLHQTWQWASVSYELAWGIFFLNLRLGQLPCIGLYKPSGQSPLWVGTLTTQREDRKKEKARNQINDFFILPVFKNEIIDSCEELYHLQTGDETFLCPVISHNSKIKVILEITLRVIGIRQKRIAGKPVETYLYRGAFLDEKNKLKPMESSHILAPGDMQEESEWEMGQGFKRRQPGEYGYGETYGTGTKAKIGDFITVAPIHILEFIGKDNNRHWSWMFPRFRNLEPGVSIPANIFGLRKLIKPELRMEEPVYPLKLLAQE